MKNREPPNGMAAKTTRAKFPDDTHTGSDQMEKTG